MTETQTPAARRMTSDALLAYLDREPHPGNAAYSESVSTLLLIVANRTDTEPDETARLIQAAANSARRRYPNACPASSSRAGYTVLAARTCMIWLGSYLGHRLPRMPGGDLDLHEALDDLSGLLFGPRGGLAHAAARLHRTAGHRAAELRAVGAYTTVRDLTAYGSSTSIHTVHGRFVYNTLRLALPHDLPAPGTPTPCGPGHLTLAQALNRAMDPARLHCTPAPGTLNPQAGTTADAREAFRRALDTPAPSLLGNPARDARGVLPVLWYGPDADDGTREREAGEMLAVAHLLGGPYREHHRNRWEQLHTGLIVLAAETSVRTLSLLITQENGPEGFEALDTLLEALHTPSGRAFGGLLPVTAVHQQLLTGYRGPLLTPWQHRTLKIIARAVGTTGSQQVQQLAAVSAEVHLQLREHPRTLARARRDTIDAHLAAATEQHAAGARAPAAPTGA